MTVKQAHEVLLIETEMAATKDKPYRTYFTETDPTGTELKDWHKTMLGCDNDVSRILVLDTKTLLIRDVSEEVAAAYVEYYLTDGFDDPEDAVPTYVECSEIHQEFMGNYTPPKGSRYFEEDRDGYRGGPDHHGEVY